MKTPRKRAQMRAPRKQAELIRNLEGARGVVAYGRWFLVPGFTGAREEDTEGA